MFDLRLETHKALCSLADNLKMDIALKRVYDNYAYCGNVEENLSEDLYAVLKYNNINWYLEDKDFNNNSITDIKFASAELFTNYMKLFNLLELSDKRHFNNMTKNLFTIEEVNHTYYTSTELRVNNKFKFTDIGQLFVKADEEYRKYNAKFVKVK